MGLDTYDKLHIDVILKDVKMTVLVSLNSEIEFGHGKTNNRQLTNVHSLCMCAEGKKMQAGMVKHSVNKQVGMCSELLYHDWSIIRAM